MRSYNNLRQVLTPGVEIGEGTVKSAIRTIEILEFFAEHQQPATILEIAQTLGYPASSTAALLKSLAMIGYLQHDLRSRTYFPTMRISLLGGWLQSKFFDDYNILDLMRTLAREGGGIVALAMQMGIHVYYLMIIDGSEQQRGYIRVGSLRPICRAATGKMLLSLMPEQKVRSIAIHANAVEPDPTLRVSIPVLLADLEKCRQCGYSVSIGNVTPEYGTVAMLLPTPPHHEPLSIFIGGTAAEVIKHQEDWIALMRSRIASYARLHSA